MKRILYIGYNIDNIYNKYKEGLFGSHLLYGAIELEKMGYEISYLSHSNQKGFFKYFKDIIDIKRKNVDILFCPYIKGLFYLFLYIAQKIGYLRPLKIMGVLHFTPKITLFNKLYIKQMYKIFNKIYFHSYKNLEECINLHLVDKNQTEILNWGVDLSYIDKNKYQNLQVKETFISTGIENRDYSTLIKVFSETDENLNIYVFHDTQIIKSNAPNIMIHKIIKEKNNQSYTVMKVKESTCVVVPINEQGLTYCTGHTSIVEALALGKPVIVTDNIYHPIDVEKEGVGLKVGFEDVDAWKNAIAYIRNNPNLIKEMGTKGRILAETKYNIIQCALQLHQYIQILN